MSYAKFEATPLELLAAEQEDEDGQRCVCMQTVMTLSHRAQAGRAGRDV